MYADRQKYPFPSAILSDFRMEGGTGLDLLRWTKQRAELKDIPFVLLTGAATEADLLEAERLGAVKIFKKPSDPSELTKILTEIAQWMCVR
jgi:CheY-like chemotaxis protein